MADTTTTGTTPDAPAGSPIGWFEVGTDDPAGARDFYGGLFGWSFTAEGPYSIVTTGPGHPLQGGIQDTRADLPAGTPGTYAVFCVQVDDVAAACRRAEELGGKVTVGATQGPAGPEYALVADPAGNQVGIFKM
jgi:predicted enzyme related to lactoylglutathione lyase